MSNDELADSRRQVRMAKTDPVRADFKSMLPDPGELLSRLLDATELEEDRDTPSTAMNVVMWNLNEVT
jgi:hypothetical protein